MFKPIFLVLQIVLIIKIEHNELKMDMFAIYHIRVFDTLGYTYDK